MTTYFFSLPDTEDLIDPSCSQKKNPTQLLGCMNPRQSGLTLEFTFGILKQLLPGRGGTSDGSEARQDEAGEDTCICDDLISFTVNVLMVVHTLERILSYLGWSKGEHNFLNSR